MQNFENIYRVEQVHKTSNIDTWRTYKTHVHLTLVLKELLTPVLGHGALKV